MRQITEEQIQRIINLLTSSNSVSIASVVLVVDLVRSLEEIKESEKKTK